MPRIKVVAKKANAPHSNTASQRNTHHRNPNASRNMGNNAANIVAIDIPDLKKKAAEGDVDAQYKLGSLYLAGYRGVVPEDKKLAYEYFFRVFTSKSPFKTPEMSAKSLYNLGCCNENGWGTPINIKSAFTFYLRAAESGNTDAMLELARFYKLGQSYDSSGNRIEKPDLAKTKEWLHKAATLHNVLQAQKILSKIYLDESYPIEAEKYSDLAATKHQDLEAIKFCILNYISFPEMFAQKINKAFTYCEKALNIIKSSSDSNVKNSLAYVTWLKGSCYLHGYGVKKNIKLAFDCFEKAKLAGYLSAEISMAKCYFEETVQEEGVKENSEFQWKKDPKKAIKILEKIANTHPDQDIQLEACFALGDYYFKIVNETPVLKEASGNKENEENKKNKENIERCIFWQQKGADLGSPSRMINLANIYASGKWVPKDYKKAEQYCRKAMELKQSEAFTLMGEWYLEGKVVKKDPKGAVKCFEQGKAFGDVYAIYQLAKCYQKGEGVPAKDIEKALELFKSIANTNAAAANDLGIYYQTMGTARDHNLSFQYYEKAVALGNLAANINLGNCYFNGWGVKKDPKRAFELYKKTVENGFVEANNNLAACYYLGRGVAVDLAKALEHINKCEKLDHPNVILLKIQIKHRLNKNNNNSQQLLEEYEHALKRIERSDPKSMEHIIHIKIDSMAGLKAYCLKSMAQLYLYGASAIRNEVKGIQYLEQAVAYDVDAEYLLGRCYLKGCGVTKDDKKAFEYFKRAAGRGSVEAERYIQTQALIEKTNDDILTNLICLPNKFEVQKSTPSGSLNTLMAEVKANEEIIESHKTFASIETLSKVQQHLQTITNQFEQALRYARYFDGRYNIVYMRVKAISEENSRTVEYEADELYSYMSQYQRCCEQIQKENTALTTLRVSLINEKAAKEKAAAAKIEDSAELLSKRTEALEQLKRAVEQQKAAESALKKQQENEKKQAEERKQKRESFLEEKKKRYEERQRALAQRAFAKIMQTKNASFKQSLSKSNKQPKPLKAVPPRTLLDWQIEVLTRKKEEIQLLERVCGYFSRQALMSNAKLSQEDIWIERETLVTILGRLFELVRTLQGPRNQSFPKPVATHLRHAMFKSDYFNMSFKANEMAQAKALEINVNLRESVAKLLMYLEHYSSKNPPKNWTELKPHIQSPLLDDLMTLQTDNLMVSRKLSFNGCVERVTTQKNKLGVLERYTGVFNDKEVLGIARAGVEARLGSLSSYLLKYKTQLLPDPSTKDEAQFQALITPKLIRKGNELRHSQKALRFSKDKNVSLANRANPIDGRVIDGSSAIDGRSVTHSRSTIAINKDTKTGDSYKSHISFSSHLNK